MSQENSDRLKAVPSLRGRYGRVDWCVVQIVGMMLVNFAGAGAGSLGGKVIGIVALAFALWLLFSSTVKRLHDLGRSGWWILLLIIPGAARVADNVAPSTTFAVVAAGQFVILAWLGLMKGESGPSRYGNPPDEWWKPSRLSQDGPS